MESLAKTRMLCQILDVCLCVWPHLPPHAEEPGHPAIVKAYFQQELFSYNKSSEGDNSDEHEAYYNSILHFTYYHTECACNGSQLNKSNFDLLFYKVTLHVYRIKKWPKLQIINTQIAWKIVRDVGMLGS